MRADRLVAMVLLLRQRGRMTADQLAAELEVSVRTVVRDVTALSTAGVPVYSDRGRHGGYSLLPGFRTELTGLTRDEALALLASGSARGAAAFGLRGPLDSALRKVVDALPDGHRSTVDDVVSRLLVEPEVDLLSRGRGAEEPVGAVMGTIREAVLSGHRVWFDYAAPGGAPGRRTVDPIGLVTVRGRTYLMATKDGQDRTYRVSRMVDAGRLPEPATRPAQVDLDRLWADRCASFLDSGHLSVRLRVSAARREEILDLARAVRAEHDSREGWLRLDVTFDDLRHAVWAVWRLGTEAEVESPASLREALGRRAAELVARYGTSPGSG